MSNASDVYAVVYLKRTEEGRYELKRKYYATFEMAFQYAMSLAYAEGAGKVSCDYINICDGDEMVCGW